MEGFTYTRAHRLLTSAAIVCVAAASPAMAQAQNFNLPALEAAQGIPAFAKQAGIQLLASARDLRGKRTNAVKGSYSVPEGLRRLLQGTGLEAKASSTGITAIRVSGARLVPVATKVALTPTPQLQAQPAPEPQSTEAQQPAEAPADIVVTGIRQSLERAAQIKQNATEVVDSIVAQDIGKLPDATTAAALQRVPGIQVSVNRNNELGDVRVRGLPDVLTTVNGREIFTTSERTFNLQDVPAEALARVDVYKSQSPMLIEGGLAGLIDLELNKPFNFKKPTLVLSARGNYGLRSKQGDPQFGALATDRWDTPIGEIGALVNVTWQRNSYERDETILSGARSSGAPPLGTPGYIIPNILQNFPEEGRLERTQANAALQWQVSPAVEAYIDLLYTRSHDRGAHYGANIQPFTAGATLTNIVPTNNCFQARVTAAGQNPTVTPDADGDPTLQAYKLQDLCYIGSATLNNALVNQTVQARDIVQSNKQIAGGFKFDQDGTKAVLDASYQTSRSDNETIITPVAQLLPTMTFVTDRDGTAHYDVPGDALTSRDNLSINNQLQQQFGVTEGNLFQAKAEATQEVGGILKNIRVGTRYARREANTHTVNLNTAVPKDKIGVLVSASGLPSDYLSLGSPAPDINDGTPFYVPNPDFLLDESKLDLLRAYFGLPGGRPAYQRELEFDARETTLSAYAELDYEVGLSDTISLDGVLGGRLTQTDRRIDTFAPVTAAGVTTLVPTSADTTDRDFLPTATARLRFGEHLQARLGYSKSIRRPNFADLNPAVRLTISNNPFVQSGGNGGNPDLKEQKSDSVDGTLEYYFHSGYVAVAGYYRRITDRVLTGSAPEMIDGVTYNVSRPRNLGQARLVGLEISGQYFMEFLPGPLSGLGLQGAFTLADSKIEGDDPLAGNPLQGVSKYNFTTGLLFEKYGISGRLVYTYRSKYFDSDQTGSISVRPLGDLDPDAPVVPTLLSYVRPAGRLDFNIGYDINPAFRIDVGGTNILRNKTKSYLGQSFSNFETFYDETTYSVGLRVRL